MNGVSGVQIRLRGVRGSIPTPEPGNAGYGGNTLCVDIQFPDGRTVIFDAGSGIRQLGIELAASGRSRLPISLFLTHFHWDHIQGLPYFQPLYDPESKLTFYASSSFGSTERALANLMAPPYHPLGLLEAGTKLDFVEFGNEPIVLPGIAVHPFPVYHPQGASGFRIECGNSAIVYVPDREHGDEKLDAVVRDYSQNADLLIHDGQYTAGEYETHRSWGHTTPEEACSVAADARVKQLVLIHHDPTHDDAFVDAMANEARTKFACTQCAREGSVFTF